MLLVNHCFNAVRKDCYKYIKFQETKTEKFKNKNRMIKTFLIPLCYWIKNKTNNRKPLLLGLSGGQGTGKRNTRKKTKRKKTKQSRQAQKNKSIEIVI